jgi:hypothetical protein
MEELRALGADHVFIDDDDGLAAAKSALGGANAALAFNAVGGDSALRLMKLLREGGTHITYGAMGRKPLTLPNGLLIFRDIRVRGLWVTRWVENAPTAEKSRGLSGSRQPRGGRTTRATGGRHVSVRKLPGRAASVGSPGTRRQGVVRPLIQPEIRN